MKQQHSLMKFDPATGAEKPYPSHAGQWRDWHGKATAWLFNPWTGTRRDAGDVGSDTVGHLIQPPGEPLYAATKVEQPLSDSDIKRIVLSNTHPADDFYAAFLNEEELIETGRRIARAAVAHVG